MNERWICNASPLIALARIRRLDLLAALGKDIGVPAAVVDELDAGNSLDGAADAIRASRTIRVIPNELVPTQVLLWQLDDGESSVLACALARPGTGAVLDDRAARRCARFVGVPVIGTIGVVALAKRLKRVEAARPIFTALRESGLFIADDLVDAVLRDLGERA